MLHVAFALLPLLPASAAMAPPDEPARVGSLVELIKEPEDNAGDAVMGWLKFFAAGYQGSADFVGQGKAADAELVIGEAIEKVVRPALAAQVGKKGKVKLNDAVDAPITKVDDSGVTVTLAKVETLVTWGDLDPKQLGLLVSKGKPTADGDVVAAAALKLLGGDSADAKQRSQKITSEIGKKLGELLEDMKEVGPQLKAGRALDGALREADPTKAVERFKAAWPIAKETSLGAGAAAGLREQFMLRSAAANGGKKALAAAFQGKVTTDPSKLHPDAGPGGVGLSIEWEFDDGAEGGDFDPTLVPKPVLAGVRSRDGSSIVPAPFLVSQSRLMQDGAAMGAGALPLEFCPDVEIELQGGLAEQLSGGTVGLIACGLSTKDGSDRVVTSNFYVLESQIGGKGAASWEKKHEGLQPGSQFATTLKLGGGKMTYARLPETSPPLPFAPSAPLRPFLFIVGVPSWFVERIVIRGTATGESMGQLARVVAEREAKALFGE
jgi:hypothetical protein